MALLTRARSLCLGVGAIKPELLCAAEGAILEGLMGLADFVGGQVAMSWASFSVTVGVPQVGPVALSFSL